MREYHQVKALIVCQSARRGYKSSLPMKYPVLLELQDALFCSFYRFVHKLKKHRSCTYYYCIVQYNIFEEIATICLSILKLLVAIVWFLLL